VLNAVLLRAQWPPLSIEVFCLSGSQQQTRRTMLQRSTNCAAARRSAADASSVQCSRRRRPILRFLDLKKPDFLRFFEMARQKSLEVVSKCLVLNPSE